MKYIEIQKKLENLKVFSVEELKILDDKYDGSKVLKWKNNGYIKSIIKGYYFYSNVKLNQKLLFQISNKIYAPSYISLESAFNYYGIIPEQTFVLTSISTKKTTNFDTDIGFFSYKKIKSDLFWGYKIIVNNCNKILIAELEKSILDYLYLNSDLKNISDFEGLRWNKDIIKEKIEIDKMINYLKMFGNKALTKRADLFFNYINNDRYGEY